jgi:hypothetical protein
LPGSAIMGEQREFPWHLDSNRAIHEPHFHPTPRSPGDHGSGMTGRAEH